MELPFASNQPRQLFRSAPPKNPAFVEAKLSDYYQDRLKAQWHGQHPLKGRVPPADAIMLRTNDYLGLARHETIIEAEVAALRSGGHGESVSRVWLHHVKDVTQSFEDRVAALMQAESAILCSSGYTANVGLVQAIALAGTPVYLDQKAHISMWEGVRSAQAKPLPFRHNDVEHLKRKVLENGPGLVCVDSLYSTDGDVAPLVDLVVLCEQLGCALLVDETHSFGAQGPDGSGLVRALGLSHRVHFRTVGLSKAVASRGGLIVSSRRNAEYIRYEALPSIFSTSVLPHEVAGYSAVLDVLANEGWRRSKLAQNHTYLRNGLDRLGYNVDASKLQIIALEAGDILQTIILRDALESQGVFGAIFFPPATPEKRCLIRFTVNCGLTIDQMDRALAVCADIRDEVKMYDWRSTRRKALRMEPAIAKAA
jgi:CAI-1 autoinducer synthase